MKSVTLEEIFKSVDESNKRFEHYTEEERAEFRKTIDEIKVKRKILMNTLYGKLDN